MSAAVEFSARMLTVTIGSSGFECDMERGMSIFSRVTVGRRIPRYWMPSFFSVVRTERVTGWELSISV